MASHDLQEPVRGVACFAAIIVEEAPNEMLRQYGLEIQRSSARMQALIAGLLEYAKLSDLTNDFAQAVVDCKAALHEALENLRIACEECGAKITCDPLPVLRTRSGRLSQVFQNLVGNAIKYRSSRAPEIHVSAEHRDGEWVFSIRDNGMGFDMADAEKVFLPFRRLHAANRDGAGVGLAMCKRIVESNGGRMFVESEPDAGSTFYFTLPAAASGAREAREGD
jgi:light-regulated signal transduction histidine kinase (bacteriophytochrome)